MNNADDLSVRLMQIYVNIMRIQQALKQRKLNRRRTRIENIQTSIHHFNIILEFSFVYLRI